MVIKKCIELTTLGEYPCQWDDLLTKELATYATVYTSKEAKKDNLKLGFTKSKDGVWDIVIAVPLLTKAVVRTMLQKLTKKTNIEYVFK